MNERIFNRRKRQVFRKRISGAELTGSMAVLGALGLVAVWVGVQGERFDPGERDISMAVLESQIVEDHLYQRPFKPWAEPGSGVEGGPRLGIFPAEALADAWHVAGRMQTFNPDNLYVKINGAAEQYLRYGFQELHYLPLETGESGGSGGQISIELYDQGDFAGALAIFSAQRDPAKPVRSEGALHYYPTGAGAIGLLGRYYFKIAGDAESELIQSKAAQLVTVLGTLPLDESDQPLGFRLLREGLGVAFHEIAYQPVNAFQYDFAHDFWFGQIAKNSPARYFLHQAESPAAAREMYELILEEHGYEYQIVTEGKESALMRHEFLKNHFSLNVRGRWVYGVENEKAPDRLKTALAKLAKALAN